VFAIFIFRVRLSVIIEILTRTYLDAVIGKVDAIKKAKESTKDMFGHSPQYSEEEHQAIHHAFDHHADYLGDLSSEVDDQIRSREDFDDYRKAHPEDEDGEHYNPLKGVNLKHLDTIEHHVNKAQSHPLYHMFNADKATSKTHDEVADELGDHRDTIADIEDDPYR
jgi:hypothetical protein